MAHFAKISDTSQVLGVHVVNNNDVLNADGVEEESVGQQYLQKHSNWPAEMWIQTSYNTNSNTHRLGGTPFRGNYAGIGFEWDTANNIFWHQKPYASWVKDTSDAEWHSPIGDAPDDLTDEEKEAGTHYVWNEGDQSWDKTVLAA
jgi:hypothetical protein